jgi:hypothetical protein
LVLAELRDARPFIHHLVELDHLPPSSKVLEFQLGKLFGTVRDLRCSGLVIHGCRRERDRSVEISGCLNPVILAPEGWISVVVIGALFVSGLLTDGMPDHNGDSECCEK